MRASRWRLVAAILFVANGAQAADEKIILELPVTIDPTANMDDDVKKQCDLAAMVSKHVLESVKEWNPSTIPVQQSENKAPHYMRVSVERAKGIEQVQIRRMTLRAEVVVGNKVVETRHIESKTTLATREEFGLCDLMNRVALKAGKGVGKWSGRAWRKTVNMDGATKNDAQ